MKADIFFDAAVIGGGPSGSVAAHNLSAHGFKVVLFEKSLTPRYKTCGGGIVRRVLNYIPSDLSHTFEKKFYSIEINDHQAEFHYIVKRNFPVVFLTMRDNFDYALLNLARSSGTKIIDNTPVYDIITDKDSLTIKTNSGDYKALFVIGADGAQGISVRKSGLKVVKKNLPALECEVYLPEKEFGKYSNLRFDFGFIPGGYAWVFPKSDHLSIGLGVFTLRNINKNLHLYFKKYLKLLGINEITRIEKHGYYIPVSLKKNLITGHRFLLTGDAVALADPVTAEGITSAVLSGKLAALSLIEGFPDKEVVENLYKEKSETQIYSELLPQQILNRVYYNYDSLRVFLIKKYGVKFCELITDIISGEKSYRGLIYNPANYLKLLKHFFYPSFNIPDVEPNLKV